MSVASALVIATLAAVFREACCRSRWSTLAYLVGYLIVTVAAFGAATSEQIQDWASRESRGTFAQRYVFGAAPGTAGRWCRPTDPAAVDAGPGP